MAIELRTFASGDQDYIAKMNSNVSTIQAAINALQQQAGAAGGPGTALSAGLFMDALFNGEDGLIGPGSYAIDLGATTLTVAPGAMYLATAQTVVQSFVEATLNFIGQTAGTHYIIVSSSGVPSRQSSLGGGAIYSVNWTGSAFIGEPVRIAACFYDAAEATASRNSTALGDLESPPEDIAYHTLDDRLEAIEEVAAYAKTTADNAITLVYEGGVGPTIKKVGITVDGIVGVKGAIQIDFAGVIIGWSVIANAVGTLEVEVSRAASSPPPAAPAIPNPMSDKISASAPIALATVQSAAASEAEVESWDGALEQWDVLQFSVVAAATITVATLYLRIQLNPSV